MFANVCIDFETILLHDPKCTDAEEALFRAMDGPDLDAPPESGGDESEDEWPHYDSLAQASDAESDSSDCRHRGNGQACAFYNREGCQRGEDCKFSHAPDNNSIRDEL